MLASPSGRVSGAFMYRKIVNTMENSRDRNSPRRKRRIRPTRENRALIS